MPVSRLHADEPSTWPQRVVDLVSTLSNSPPVTYSGEEQAEAEFMDMVSGDLLVVYHFTRLLPSGVADLKQHGLGPLVLADWRTRLATDLASVGESASLVREFERQSPLSWQGTAEDRIGSLYLAGPLSTIAADDPSGVERLLTHFGGEVTYWSGDHTGTASAQAALDRASRASVVELAISPEDLSGFQPLWRLFVGQLRHEPIVHEWTTRSTHPVTRVWQSTDADWPVGLPA